MPIEVVYAESFLRAARQLQKRYPHVLDDIDALSDRLERGETPGDRLQGLERIAFKARLRNRDAGRGKSGGYRVITYFAGRSLPVFLLTLYAKGERANLSPAERNALHALVLGKSWTMRRVDTALDPRDG